MIKPPDPIDPLAAYHELSESYRRMHFALATLEMSLGNLAEDWRKRGDEGRRCADEVLHLLSPAAVHARMSLLDR